MSHVATTTRANTNTSNQVGDMPGGAGDKTGQRLYLFICVDVVQTVNTPAGWTAVTGADLSGPDGQSVRAFWKNGGASEPATVTVSCSGSNTGIVQMTALSGRDLTASPVFQPTTNTSANSTPVSIGATGVTAVDGDDIIVFNALDQTVGADIWAFAGPGSYAERADSSTGDWAAAATYTRENLSAGATGTLTSTATRSSGSGQAGWAAYVVRDPVAAGGGGGDGATQGADLGSRRNRPGRGPYSIGRYFRPAVEAYRTSASSVVSATASLSAVVQVAQAATAGLEAAVQAAPSSTSAIDLALQQLRTAAASLDVAVQASAAAAASLEAAVQAERTASASVDAVVQSARTATASLDLAAQLTRTQSASLDMQVQATTSASASIDMQVQAGSSVSAALELAVLEAKALTASADLAVQLPRNTAAAIDVALLQARTAAASLDLYVQAGFSAGAQVDAAVQAVLAAVAGVQLAVMEVRQAGASLDAAVAVQRLVTSAVDAAVQERRQLGAAIDLMVAIDNATAPRAVDWALWFNGGAAITVEDHGAAVSVDLQP